MQRGRAGGYDALALRHALDGRQRLAEAIGDDAVCLAHDEVRGHVVLGAESVADIHIGVRPAEGDGGELEGRAAEPARVLDAPEQRKQARDVRASPEVEINGDERIGQPARRRGMDGLPVSPRP